MANLQLTINKEVLQEFKAQIKKNTPYRLSSAVELIMKLEISRLKGVSQRD